MQNYTVSKGLISSKIWTLGLLFSLAGVLAGQEPSPKPTPDETIKITTEEVHLNVMAVSDSGRFVPSLTANDLLVVEEGDPQTITSIKKVPAAVLLLLDTGDSLNFAKRVSTTRLVAQLFVDCLSREDTLAVMQYYDKIELLSDWTHDFDGINATLNSKLFSGRRNRLNDALNAAIEKFKSQPLENRHLVLISDGSENVVDDEARRKAMRDLVAANITVHVLSYTALEETAAAKASQRFRMGDGKTKPRVDALIWQDIVRGLPVGGFPEKGGFPNPKTAAKIREHLRMLNESQALVIFDTDIERGRRIRQRRDEWHENQVSLQKLAEDTGGVFNAPEEAKNLFRGAIETANAIDSSYVITYAPSKAVADSDRSVERKVRVSTPINGVNIRSRQKVVWGKL